MSAKREVIIGQAFGIGSALAYGTSSVFIRRGVTNLAPPLVGAAIALLAATLGLAIFSLRDLSGTSLRQNRQAVGLLLISGVANSLGIIASFFALSLAPVVTIGPLQSINPLFTLLFSHLFLSHLEKITPKLVVGSLLVVVGVILITLGRAA